VTRRGLDAKDWLKERLTLGASMRHMATETRQKVETFRAGEESLPAFEEAIRAAVRRIVGIPTRIVALDEKILAFHATLVAGGVAGLVPLPPVAELPAPATREGTHTVTMRR
jgi:hypothetical protein